MIHYSLICDALHEFDGWFRDSAAFDAQAADGAIACPFCRSVKVAKAVMAPHVARPARSPEATARSSEGEEGENASALMEDHHRQLRAKLSELRETLLSATEDVGEHFPAEARKIQDGEAKARPIRGRASLAEAKALVEDGIEILPLPGEGH